MTCDDCIKKDVCKYKEQCNILERNITGNKIEDVITLEVKCKHKQTIPHPICRGPFDDLIKDCSKTPFRPVGERPTVRFGDDSGCMPT